MIDRGEFLMNEDTERAAINLNLKPAIKPKDLSASITFQLSILFPVFNRN